MLSKLKKKSEAAATAVPAWHLDFRLAEELPDVKPIRTAFFINGIAILVAAGMLLMFAYQELQIHALHVQIADWNAEIGRDKAPSGAAVQLFKKFQSDEKVLKEAAAFLDTPISVSAFMMRLGVMLPDHITIDSIDWRGSVINLHATVLGSPDEASGYASAMVDKLTHDEVFDPVFEPAVLTSLLRNPTSGLLSMDIRMQITTEK